MSDITVQGARTHNLKNISLRIPRNKLVVITGLSGSGKSSLAFDTLYAEGQRRYVESLSAYARQFLSMMEKPDVDHIEGLSPAIAIEQKCVSHNPRSTVGTITEIYDYLRLLYARVGQPRCPTHNTVLNAQTITQMVDAVLAWPEGTKLMLLAPLVRSRKGEHKQVFEKLQAQGFVRVRVDGTVFNLEDVPSLDSRKKHSIDLVVDRFKVRGDLRLRLSESFETALRLSEGLASIALMDSAASQVNTDLQQPTLRKKENETVFSSKFACPTCGYSVPSLEPRLFSFNSPIGACSECDGLGVTNIFDVDRVVLDKALSLAGGAIRGWDAKNRYYYSLLSSLAQHYRFDINTPFDELPETLQKIILYGSGTERIRFHYITGRGRRLQRTHAFEGVIPNMTRRYRETDSELVRQTLSKYLSQAPCKACGGSRLCEAARHVFVGDRDLPDIVSTSVGESLTFFENVCLTGQRSKIAQSILREIASRLHFLVSVGLDYLTLDRSAETLSGGEAQRIRLASQIGSGLVGVLYILDEPSIGLHQRDNQRLLDTLFRLRDLGNTVLAVEHDEDTMRQADHIVDMGPGAGVKGGHVVAQGTAEEISCVADSITGDYLVGRRQIPVPTRRVPYDLKRCLRLEGVSCNNLKAVDVSFPVGLMTCVTGVSGSGKSSLINDTLYPLAARALNNACMPAPTAFKSINGLGFFDKVIAIDQSPIGRTPRSNPATYTGLFGPLRDLFAGTQEARSRGYKPGRFSFNVAGGRCEACQGGGVIKVEMHFLADVYVTCDVCQGHRYNRETLDIHYKGKNIYELLSLTVDEACDLFKAVPLIHRKLQTLVDVGLGYIHLGQSATTLSGGEAQRIKLAKELSKRATGNTLYILDEPTTGLHFHDVKQLLDVLLKLRDYGNTIIIIEHNLDVIKTADWIIDLGPEGGDKGGRLLACGAPETVVSHPTSYTANYLRAILEN